VGGKQRDEPHSRTARAVSSFLTLGWSRRIAQTKPPLNSFLLANPAPHLGNKSNREIRLTDSSNLEVSGVMFKRSIRTDGAIDWRRIKRAGRKKRKLCAMSVEQILRGTV